MVLPSGETLRSLERESRKVGTNLDRDSVLGIWRLAEVWGKKDAEPSSLSSEILRRLKATLAIKDAEQQELALTNSVEFLGIKLSFIGTGELVTKRPLLCFQFDDLRIEVAGRKVFSFALPDSSARRKPFFALIAKEHIGTGQAWMAARGRGGGLALWVNDDAMSA